MRNQKNLTSLLIIMLFIISVASVYAIDGELSETVDNNQCRNLYRFDKNNKECELKQFCGEYMYLGLNTFAEKDICLYFANKTNCPTEIMCREGYEGCTGEDGCPTCCEKICQNFPPPDFCPGGTADIIITGTDNHGCSTYGCRSIPNLILLYADFAGSGIWKWNSSTWMQATPNNPERMVTSGTTLYASFAGVGIWKWDGSSWMQTIPNNPQSIAGTATTLYGTFAGLGIWQWNGTEWTQTTASNPQKIVASASDLYGSFAGLGIWKFNGTNWTQLTTSIPDLLVTSGEKLHGTFAGLGIWLWNGTQWAQATANTPQMIAANSTTLYGTFEGQGIWSWDGASTWTQISTENPTQMVASGTELYAAFAGTGISKWNGTSWTLISGNEPVRMVVGN